jgi:siroheme synthase
MHGAPADTAVTAVENASRPDQRVIATTLIELPKALADVGPDGPVMILYGLAPRAAALALDDIREAL